MKGYARVITKEETRQAGYKPAKEDHMICSRRFAEWLLKISREEGHEGELWMDVILRYCNAAYPEMILEEMRKANDFFYSFSYDTDEDWISIQPSYEIVALYALDPADEEHILPVSHPVRSYSILTTGASFPGKQQFPYDNDFPVTIKDLTYDCINYAYSCYSRADWPKVENSRIHNRTLMEDPGICQRLAIDDTYSYREFLYAEEEGFIDNEMPYCSGPSCPDRFMRKGSYAHTRHELIKGAADICRKLDVRKEYSEFYWLAIVMQFFGKAGQIPVGAKLSLKAILQKADNLYNKETAWLEDDEEKNRHRKDAGTFDTEFNFCEMIYLSLCSNVRYRMEKTPDSRVMDALDAHKHDALANKEYAFAHYRFPQEIF